MLRHTHQGIFFLAIALSVIEKQFKKQRAHAKWLALKNLEYSRSREDA